MPAILIHMRRLLVLGGTGFLGHSIVQAALSDRESDSPHWSVTTFNRGVSGPDAPGTTAIRGDRYDPDSLDILTRSGPWDAVIDCSGYVPRNQLFLERDPVPTYLPLRRAGSANHDR